ncbi:protein lifeguard 1-like [Macrobrachium nipponense]|uniref:protein lifeguard 1-like n=1 Tax=Macrobrachium nipponense TaxID=159736 RepID=UPI0030C7E51C
MSDPESVLDDGMAEAFSEKAIRLGFIRKVYGILFIQLLITFGIIAIFTYVDEVKTFTQDTPALFWAAFGLTLAMIIVLGCCGDIRRKSPHNYIALFVFTLCEGYLLGTASALFDAKAVALAIVVTLVIVLALTLFAFQTKYDFTLKGGLLMALLLSLMMFGIFAGIFHSYIAEVVYASLGALLFSAYIVFDTQLIVGGKHRIALSPEEYVFAALNLYLDIVNLFLYILTLVGTRN